MKRKVEKIVVLVLVLSLFVNMVISTQAANENNTLGVAIGATLDKPVISVSDTEQVVTMSIDANQIVTLDGIAGTIVWDNALALTAISNSDSRIDFSGSVNLENGKIAYSEDNVIQLDSVTNIAVATFTVPANTPAGTYEIGMENIELTKNYGDIWENTAYAKTILTIQEEPVVEGYSAEINTLTSEISVGDTTTINVSVYHSEDETFAAGEVVVTYDPNLMTFAQSASVLGSATVKDENGSLTLEDYGADKNFGSGVYSLVFNAIADGEAEITLVSATFVNKGNAVKYDLIPATLTKDTVNVTISKRTYEVESSDIFEGSIEAIEGEDYTFSVTDNDNYEYTVSATMNGKAVDVVDNGNGTYTIKNVTGALVITGKRTEKTYNVRFEGNAATEITDGGVTATYNTDYTFTVPTASGWAYSIVSITINGVAYTGYEVENSVCKISGSAISGDIIITVTKSQTEANVTVDGTGASAAEGYNPVATIGKEYILTISPEAGYTYSITATMGGSAVEVANNGDNTYTIGNVTGNIVFTVNKTVVVDGVTVVNYLTLDGTIMWLVKNDTTLENGKVPTYDGINMFWSEKYGTYCYLVLAETLSIDTAKANIGITDGTPVIVDYGMDVNKTGKIDASDAQLIYNMYNAVYNELNEDVTMEKFLRADINGNETLNVEDAAAVIAEILK